MNIKVVVFSVMTSYSLAFIYQYFRRTYSVGNDTVSQLTSLVHFLVSCTDNSCLTELLLYVKLK